MLNIFLAFVERFYYSGKSTSALTTDVTLMQNITSTPTRFTDNLFYNYIYRLFLYLYHYTQSSVQFLNCLARDCLTKAILACDIIFISLRAIIITLYCIYNKYLPLLAYKIPIYLLLIADILYYCHTPTLGHITVKKALRI